MAVSNSRSMFCSTSLSRRLLVDKRRGLFLLPICLAFTSSFFLFLYTSSTSKPDIGPTLTRIHTNPRLEFSRTSSPVHSKQSSINHSLTSQEAVEEVLDPDIYPGLTRIHTNPRLEFSKISSPVHPKQSSINHSLTSQEAAEEVLDHHLESTPSSTTTIRMGTIDKDKITNNDDVFHDKSIFMKDYKRMNKTLKIYAYPHDKDDSFANVLLPVNSKPGGNYASESYFKKSLFKSHFLTKDPSKADLFYLPFSIASLRHDKRIGVGGIQDFVASYVANISRSYPFWNRSGGADHFYVACHSVGRSAMEKAVRVKLNAIQVVCSSSYFLSGYVAHKDASIPQIWPRNGAPPTRSSLKRKTLAFYAGAMNSRVRENLVKTWGNDSEISVHYTRLKTPYSEALLGSKFCIHAKGFEVNTARIGDALYYGCVPVVLADHYDLPYSDILNWNSFSVVLSSVDIPMLKKILEEIVRRDEYLMLQKNVMRVQKHFQWHDLPLHFDAFYMVMYELWLRRSHVRIT